MWIGWGSGVATSSTIIFQKFEPSGTTSSRDEIMIIIHFTLLSMIFDNNHIRNHNLIILAHRPTLPSCLCCYKLSERFLTAALISRLTFLSRGKTLIRSLLASSPTNQCTNTQQKYTLFLGRRPCRPSNSNLLRLRYVWIRWTAGCFSGTRWYSWV